LLATNYDNFSGDYLTKWLTAKPDGERRFHAREARAFAMRATRAAWDWTRAAHEALNPFGREHAIDRAHDMLVTAHFYETRARALRFHLP
jgi:hypothetical protein